jgi:hypothetical protein
MTLSGEENGPYSEIFLLGGTISEQGGDWPQKGEGQTFRTVSPRIPPPEKKPLQDADKLQFLLRVRTNNFPNILM